MTKIEELKLKMQKAVERRNLFTGEYRKLRQNYEAQVQKINDDRELNSTGKARRIDKVKNDTIYKLMEMTKANQTDYQNLLNDLEADATIYLDSLMQFGADDDYQAGQAIQLQMEKMRAEGFFTREGLTKEMEKLQGLIEQKDKLKKEKSWKMEKFERQLNDLKTEITLSTPSRAMEKIEAFVNSVQDRELADRVRGEFKELIKPIVGHIEFEDKQALLELFDDTQRRILGEDGIAAKEIIESAKGLQQSDFVPLAVINSTNDTFGRKYAYYLKNPDAYFEQNEQ